jgi:hypothetical protein
MKKLGVMVALCLVIGAFTVNSAGAYAWYTCTVDQAGSMQWGAYVVLTDTAVTPAFPAKTTFIIDTSDAANMRSMLASALTAFANSTNLAAFISAPAAYNIVSGAFASK